MLFSELRSSVGGRTDNLLKTKRSSSSDAPKTRKRKPDPYRHKGYEKPSKTMRDGGVDVADEIVDQVDFAQLV